MLFCPSVDVMWTMDVVHCCQNRNKKRKRKNKGRSYAVGEMAGRFEEFLAYICRDFCILPSMRVSLLVTIMPSLIVVVRYGFSILDISLPLITATRATGCIPSVIESIHLSARACICMDSG